ncbi:MAG: STAS domain-containing protein [Gammaproteobacteria bacterium]
MAEAGFTDRGNGSWLLEGELDYYTVPGVLASSARRMTGEGSIRVDLKGVTRADSAGLALLLAWLRDAERAGRSISFVNVPAQLQSIARVCGLEEILPLSH